MFIKSPHIWVCSMYTAHVWVSFNSNKSATKNTTVIFNMNKIKKYKKNWQQYRLYNKNCELSCEMIKKIHQL